MNKFFQIGSFCFSLSYPEEVKLPDNFLLFENPNAKPEYFYSIHLTENFPAPEGNSIAMRRDLEVFHSENLESRLIGSVNWDAFHASYIERDPVHADIYMDSLYAEGSDIDTMFCGLLALERRMVQHDSLILHCAYIRYKDEAILFSAPSETGKTTQANLWEKYRHSETINGDKSLLQKIDGRWMAQGWPVCGSSDVCRNESTPIRAIVMLSQDRTNHAERLKGMAAFTQLYSQITVNSWNRDFVNHNMDLIEQLITDVPVYHLGCTISEEAVSCLANALYDPGKNMQADTEARS